MRSRSATMASVGFAPGPPAFLKKPPSWLLKAVTMARVPLMPTSQSVSAREQGGGLQRLELVVVAQVGEGLADGGLRHGLQPQALDRLLHARILNDVAEDQFALAPRVTGVDDGIDILALARRTSNLAACRVDFLSVIPARIQAEYGQVKPTSPDRIVGRAPPSKCPMLDARRNVRCKIARPRAKPPQGAHISALPRLLGNNHQRFIHVYPVAADSAV